MTQQLPQTQDTLTAEEYPGVTRLLSTACSLREMRECEGARVDLRSDWELRFEYPATWTEAEARATLAGLAPARALCHLIISSLPADVVPVILPQLKDMAEYETRIWQLRQERVPAQAHEKWISLPITA